MAFAEVEKFIDTPVKHYSSGMYVRLAFAVAAHLEPEILLVDEVLAVGDITFQKKCLGKMGDVARAGRTVVLVSHNMAAINALSSRVVMIKDGGIVFDGPGPGSDGPLLCGVAGSCGRRYQPAGRVREGNGKARFSAVSIQLLSRAGKDWRWRIPVATLHIEFEIECRSEIADANAAIVFYDMNGYRVIDTNTAQKGEFVSMAAGQRARARFLLHDVLLKPGKYFVGLWIGRHMMETIDFIEHAVTLDVMEGEETGEHGVTYPGVYLCRFENNVSIG